MRDAVTAGMRVEVGWSPGGDDHDGQVQVAAINANRVFVPNVVFDEKGNPAPVLDTDRTEIDGWYVSLDREGINRMIRLLRHARDKAYGADA